MDRPLKSLWKGAHGSGFSFLCPLCRASRRVKMQPRPQARHFVQVGLTSLTLMLATWSQFEWKGIISFVPLWFAFELIYRSRVRVALHCPHCGFDPYLYLVDVKRARAEVQSHWRKKFAEKGVPFPGDEPGGVSGLRPDAHLHDTAQGANGPLTEVSPEG